MWTKDEGYYSQFKYVEVARYLEIDGIKMVARYMQDKKNKIPLLINVNEVGNYAEKNDNTGIYTSIFRYNGSQFRDSAVRLGSLYFDIDSDNHEQSRQDAITLVENLKSSIPSDALRIYFTGKKGFHVECEAITLGITPGTGLPAIFRYIAEHIKDRFGIGTLDFAVYDSRRMWRWPNSRHQGTGLYKIPITIDELCSYSFKEISEIAYEPRVLDIPPQEFSIKANEWYREYVYSYEQKNIQQKTTAQSIIERFNSQGSGHIHDYQREFDPIKLFEGCPVILELWNKAERTKNLGHEERLFLCSILTYTDEAIEYLHSILSNCSDYNFEKSQSHIDDWIRRREMGIGGNPYSCERARSAGIECAGCEKLEPKQKFERIGDKLYPTNEISSPSPIRFAYSRKVDFKGEF